MKNKNYLISLFLIGISAIHSAEASYTLPKIVFYLFKKGVMSVVKTVGYGVPTVLTIKKINDHIKNEQQEYFHELFFTYPFDENAQQQNTDLQNEIVQYALQTMPDKWKACTSAEELLQKISTEKENSLSTLKEIIEFKDSLPSWEERKKISEVSLKQLMDEYNKTFPDVPRLHFHADGGRPDLLENFLTWCKQNGIDNNALEIDINKYAILPTFIENMYIYMLSPMGAKKNFNIPVYTLQISPTYAESTAPFIKGAKKHELNHVKTGDCDYNIAIATASIDTIKKINFCPEKIYFREILPFLKEKLSLRKELNQINNAKNYFSMQAEYHADINPVLSDSTLTTKEKAEALKNYSSLFEHWLTFDATTQIKAQQNTNYFLDLLQEGFGVNEHSIDVSYDFKKQDQPWHPSILSRYQLIARAIQLLSLNKEQ